MRRAFDLIAVAAVAVVLLLPKASLQAKVALAGEKIELDKSPELRDARVGDPNSVGRAAELADAFLRLLPPDGALPPAAEFEPRNDHRIALVRATAYAERLEAK